MVLTNIPITFTDVSTGNVSTSWDFGDGTAIITGSSVSHTFFSAGTFRVIETITSPTGETKSCFQDIVVSSSLLSKAGVIIGVVVAVGVTAAIAYLLTKRDVNVDRDN